MLTKPQRNRDMHIEEELRMSRASILNDDDSRYMKGDGKDNINARLAKNFNEIVELLRERKELILRKIKRMFEENAERTEAISRGRMQDLKNEAKLLRDETISSLVENNQRINNTKNLLKRIVEQHNFSQFQTMEKAKGKKFYDRCREVQSDISTKSKRFNQAIEQLEKLNDKEKQIYTKLQERQNDMRLIMKRREGDYMRKVEHIQTQLQKYRTIIRQNKSLKDRKKKDVQNVLAVLMDTLIAHEDYTITRVADIQDLFGGCEDVHDFDRFIRQFQNIIANKFDQKKDGKKEAALQQMMKIANGYEAYVEQLHKDRHNQTILLEDINQGLKVQIKLALIEKVYFHEISNDRQRLNDVLRKCKNYKTMLDNFEGENQRLHKELNKINHMKNSFAPKLKALATEQIRKEDLKKQLSMMMGQYNQVARMAKKYKDYEYLHSTYSLTKQILQKQIDELADKGNLSEYKSKIADLQALERDYRGKSDVVSVAEFERIEAQFNGEVQNLYARYADIIEDILVEDERLSASDLIAKLSKRMSII